jgi:hypothetical protein
MVFFETTKYIYLLTRNGPVQGVLNTPKEYKHLLETAEQNEHQMPNYTAKKKLTSTQQAIETNTLSI